MEPMTAAMLVMFIASTLISVFMQPKAQTPKAATFDDFDMPQTEEGTPLTVFFGTCSTKSWTVIGMGDFRTKPVKAGSAKK